MGTNSKHTPVKLFGAEITNGKEVIALCTSSKENGLRIVEAWNNWDEVLDLLENAKHDIITLLANAEPGSYRATTTQRRIQELQHKLLTK